MRRKIIAGNWKMYKDMSAASAFAQSFQGVKNLPVDIEVIIAAQSPLLPGLQKEFAGSRVKLAVQNIHWEKEGAFTGELSIALAQAIGASFTLVGHSERRQFFGETKETAAKRAVAAAAAGLAPIFCIGESRQEREAQQTESVLRAQCAPLFALAPTPIPNFIVAYEPVWAIGTGLTATTAQAQEAQAFVRELFQQNWGSAAASLLPILYGGSVKPDNAPQLMACADVDGVLVGGASLDPAGFLAIAAAAK